MKICKLMLAVLICGFMLTACATTGKRPSICETTTEPSYLCEVAEKAGLTVEEIGLILIVSNALALDGNFYSIEDTVKVLKELDGILENPVSYLFVRSQIVKYTHRFPGVFTVTNELLDELKSPRIMSRFDRMLLQGWIRKQIKTAEELRDWPR